MSHKFNRFGVALAAAARTLRSAARGGRLRETSGSVAIVFALAFLVIFALIGGAVDFGLAITRKDETMSTLDMAVVAAAAQIKDGTRADDEDSRQTLADQVVRAYVANADTASMISGLAVVVTSDGLEVTIKATARGLVPTSILGVFGISAIDFALASTSVVTVSPYIDVTLLVDTSGSMSLGATTADIDRLKSQFGCAFACHDNPGNDSFAWAEANGVKLRYDLIRDAVLNFADYVDTVNKAGRTRVQVYTFDDVLRLNQALTSTMALVRSNLPAAPQTSSETAGGTRWWTYADGIPGLVGSGGDGSTPAKSIKLVMMLTDGVQDPNRTWTWNLPLRDYVREFDWSACDRLRANRVKMGVVQVPYLDMPWDWGYVATLGQPSLIGGGGDRHADTTTALKRCGGDLYYLATSADSVTESFKTLYMRALPPRLSK